MYDNILGSYLNHNLFYFSSAKLHHTKIQMSKILESPAQHTTFDCSQEDLSVHVSLLDVHLAQQAQIKEERKYSIENRQF